MKKALVTIIVAALSASAWAQGNFIAEFDAAKKLAPEESEAALSKLSETAPKRVRDEVLALAADKAAMQKKYDIADKYVEQITDKNAQDAAKINVLTRKMDWKGIVAFAKDLKFEEYPDNLIPRAMFQRGQAYGMTKDKVNAYKDFESAIKSTGNPPVKSEMIYQAANIAGTQLGDYAKQIEFLSKFFPDDILKLTTGLRQRIISMYAEALIAQGKAEDAIKFLDDNAKLVTKISTNVYLIKESYAKAYAAKGDKKKAAEYYTEASKLEQLPSDWAERAKAKAEELTK
jgi:tetratricopeptide (TPR) repeat protein